MWSKIGWVAGLAFVGMVGTAGAQDDIYTTGPSVQLSNAWGMSGTQGGIVPAVSFALSHDATITGAQVVASCGDPSIQDQPGACFLGQFDWGLYTDNGGLPGAQLQAGSVVPVELGTPGDANPYRFDLPSLAVTGGQRYWLSVLNVDPTGAWTGSPMLFWDAEYNKFHLPGAGGIPGVGWSALPASDEEAVGYGNRLNIELYGTVPEPSSLALLGTGLMGLVPLIRRRRRSV